MKIIRRARQVREMDLQATVETEIGKPCDDEQF